MQEYKYSEVKDAIRQQIIGLDEGLQLRAIALNGSGWQWSMVQVTARGSTTHWPLPDLGAPGQIERDIQEQGLRNIGLRTVLLALPSLGRRPKDYGTSRVQLDSHRRAGNVLAIVGSIPLQQKIGKTKVLLATATERFGLASKLDAWPAGRIMVLALSAEPQDTKVVGVRIPADILHRLTSEATASLLSPGQFILALLQDRYPSG